MTIDQKEIIAANEEIQGNAGLTNPALTLAALRQLAARLALLEAATQSPAIPPKIPTTSTPGNPATI